MVSVCHRGLAVAATMLMVVTVGVVLQSPLRRCLGRHSLKPSKQRRF